MYTNELLQEKYNVQKRLNKQAEDANEDYSYFIENQVRSLFQEKAWNINFSKRKGEYIENSSQKNTG